MGRSGARRRRIEHEEPQWIWRMAQSNRSDALLIQKATDFHALKNSIQSTPLMKTLSSEKKQIGYFPFQTVAPYVSIQLTVYRKYVGKSVSCSSESHKTTTWWMRSLTSCAIQVSPEEGAYFSDYCNWQNIPQFRCYALESVASQIAAQLMQSQVIHFLFEDDLILNLIFLC